jgi:LPXTG-motif cell wall-anchored protein
MTDKNSTHGLSCPNCGGIVPVPEGQRIVQCPYCNLRSMVRGERGLLRYQVPRRIDRQQALSALRDFLKGHRSIASNAAKRARLTEDFVAYVPFWTAWARVLGWVFGQKRVRRNDRTEFDPREVHVARQMNWNSVACDIGEFGVDSVPLGDQTLDPFDPQELHESGMVFEPVGSSSEARKSALSKFTDVVRQAADLERISQVFVRFVNQRLGLVYYPLWVMRYDYRGRAFQVVVDGYNGQVLYGKAPGNTLYRAAVLVGGMALGAFLAIDASAISLYIAAQTGDDGAFFFLIAGLFLFLLGFGLIAFSYRAFRHGEQFEYRIGEDKSITGYLRRSKDIYDQIEDVTSWTDLLN